MSFIILHHHIFKNAGTTFEYACEHFFRSHSLFVETFQDHNFTKEDLRAVLRVCPGTQVISSHSLRGQKIKLNDLNLFNVAFVREPLKRIASMYHYYQGLPAFLEHDIAKAAKTKDFNAWAEWLAETQPYLVENPQFKLLCRFAHINPSVASEADLPKLIDGFGFVGQVERFHDSMTALEIALRQRISTIDLRYRVSNESVKQSSSPQRSLSFSDTLRQQFETLSRLDSALCREVSGRLDVVKAQSGFYARAQSLQRRCEAFRWTLINDRRIASVEQFGVDVIAEPDLLQFWFTGSMLDTFRNLWIGDTQLPLVHTGKRSITRVKASELAADWRQLPWLLVDHKESYFKICHGSVLTQIPS